MYYRNINDFVKGAAKTVIHHGIKGSIGYWQGVEKYIDDPIKEMANLYMVVPMHNNQSRLAKETMADIPWAEDHFQERINPKNHKEALNPGYAYKYWPHAKFKEEGDDFARLNKNFSHTYMERFWPKQKTGNRFKMGNWETFIDNAKNNPKSRQLFFPIYYPEDTDASFLGERVPCTLGYHFQVFGGFLHLSYFIRSCDLQKHFRNDVYFTVRLAQELKSKVPAYKNMPLGNLNIWIGNLHCFLNDQYKVSKWIK
jgi:thymidylate synthase